MRTMAIIGIIWFSLSIILISVQQNEAKSSYYGGGNVDGVAGWGYLGLLYGIAFAIVVLSNAKKKPETEQKTEPQKRPVPNTNTDSSTTQKLIELNELKQKGILNDDEFQAMKSDLLKKMNF